jgi:hypothetical protein
MIVKCFLLIRFPFLWIITTERRRTTSCARWLSKKQERTYGYEKKLFEEVIVEEKIFRAQIWKGRRQNRGQRHAPKKERHPAFWKRRQRRKGEEPQAGHRHWTFGGPQEGRKGSAQEVNGLRIQIFAEIYSETLCSSLPCARSTRSTEYGARRLGSW